MAKSRSYKRDWHGRFARGSGGGPGRGNKGAQPRGKYTSGKKKKPGRFATASRKRKQNRARHKRVVQNKGPNAKVVAPQTNMAHKGKKKRTQHQKDVRRAKINAAVGVGLIAASIYLDSGGGKKSTPEYKRAKARDKWTHGGGAQKFQSRKNRARAAGFKVHKMRNKRGPKITFPTGPRAGSALVRR